MLRRTEVHPFVRRSGSNLEVDFLSDPDGRAAAFLDRLRRLLRRLEGMPRRVVVEALRRQERRIGDSRRLAGVNKMLLDLCEFRPPAGSRRAPEIRAALFRARGERWPPLPSDLEAPYRCSGEHLGMSADEVKRLLYADAPEAYLLARVPGLDGRALVDRYNLELARGVLLDASRLTLTAVSGWRDIFRAVKLARLMYRLAPSGDGYRVELTGPAEAYITRPQRYGARFARVIPALVRAPGWRLEAAVDLNGRRLRYRLDASSDLVAGEASDRFDSAWERALAEEFADKVGGERDGWRLLREHTPVAVGDELFLPDFTLRHADGRQALVEVVGFWTPEYLDAKLRKVSVARLDTLILVVYEGLAAGALEAAAAGPVLRFKTKPRIGAVMEAAERVAR